MHFVDITNDGIEVGIMKNGETFQLLEEIKKEAENIARKLRRPKGERCYR